MTDPTPEDDPERTFDLPPPTQDDALEGSLDTVLEDARSVPTILTPREDGRPAAPPPRERRASTSLNRDAVEAAVRKGLITRVQGTSFLERSGSGSDVLEVMVGKGLLEADAAERLREEVAEDFVPGYRVIDELGRGGMGVVYRAVHRSLNRQVALKVITPELRLSREHADRFKREAQTLAALNHPNIVQVYDTGEVGDKLYISLELVDGEDLGEYVKRKERLGWREATEVVLDAARGLGHAYASDAKVIHRDVKPGNLLRAKVAGFSRHLTKVTDLGLARMRGDQSSGRQTKAGTIMGSPSYMAPEQASGDPVDHRADIYSLGATYYHFLVGEPPFVGQVVQVLRARLSGEQVASPGDRVEGIPAAVQRVIDRMLAQEPEHRYPNYDALIADLEAVHAGQVPRAPRVPREASSLAFAAGDAPELGAASATTEVLSAAAPPAVKGSGGGAAVLGVLLLLGAIVGGLYLTQSGPPEPPPTPDDVGPVETALVEPPPVDPALAIRERIAAQLEQLAGLEPAARLAVEDPGMLWTRLDELPPLQRAPLRVRLEELARETVASAVARATALHSDADYAQLREVCAAARAWATAAELELGDRLETLERFAEQGSELGNQEREALAAIVEAADAGDHATVLERSEGFAERYPFCPDLERVREARALAEEALPLLQLSCAAPNATVAVDGVVQPASTCELRVPRGTEVVCTVEAEGFYPLRRTLVVDAPRAVELRPSPRRARAVTSEGDATSLFGQVGPTTRFKLGTIGKRGWTFGRGWSTDRDDALGVFAWYAEPGEKASLLTYRMTQDTSPLGANANLATRLELMFSLTFGLRASEGRFEVRLLGDGPGAEHSRQVALRIEGRRVQLGAWFPQNERFRAEATHDLPQAPASIQLDWDGERVVVSAGPPDDRRPICSFSPDWTPRNVKEDALVFLAHGPLPQGQRIALINPKLNPLLD